MPQLAFLAVLVLIIGAMPVQAADESTSYNYRSAPKGQTMDVTEEEKAEAVEEAKKTEEEEELTPQQKEARERRKITGEGSDVPHGDEHKWPHIGRKR